MMQWSRVAPARVGAWVVAGWLGAQLAGCATPQGGARGDDASALAWATQDAHALVWADARFHFERDGARAVRAFDFGPEGRAARPGQVFRVRVLDRRDGWTQVSTVGGAPERHCVPYSPVGASGLGLIFWVRDADLAPVLAQPVTRVFDDGTQAALRAGTPVFDGRPWAYGFALPVALNPEAVGDVYTTDPPAPENATPPAAQGQPERAFDYRRVTLKTATLGGAEAPWQAPPWSYSEGVVYGDVSDDGRLLFRAGGCGALLLGLPPNATVEEAGVSGILGAMLGGANLRQGAALSWRDGTLAGHARDGLFVNDAARVEDSDARICWVQAFGEAWSAPGHRGDKVTLCAQRADVITAKPNAPGSLTLAAAPSLSVAQADALFADPAARAAEPTTAAPADAPSLVSLSARYDEAKRAFVAAMASSDLAGLKAHIKRLADFHALYLAGLQAAPQPAERLHLLLATGDLQWDIARGLQTAPVPPGVAKSDDTVAQYRALLSDDYVRPLLFKAFQAYQRAASYAAEHRLALAPSAQARLRLLEGLWGALEP